MKRMERWLVYPVLGLLCWAVFGDALPTRRAEAADKDARFGAVQAKRFEVIDKAGKPVAILAANERGGGALIILTAKQQPVLELGVRRDAGVVTLLRHTDKARPMAQIAANKEGRGQLAIFGDAVGSACVVIGRDDNGGNLSIRSNDGAACAGVTVSPGGTGFMAVTAGDGRPKAYLGVGQHGGVAGVKTLTNEPAVTMHVVETGGVVNLHTKDEKK